VESALIGAGYDLALYRLTDNPDQRRALVDYCLVRKVVDAVVALTLFINDDDIKRLTSLGKPILGIGGRIPQIPTFSIDNVAISRRATERPIELGHTKLLHLGGGQERQLDFEVHSNRLAGFRQARATAGLSRANNFIGDDFDMAGGCRSELKALADPNTRPTGVVAGSDEMALGVITAARELGFTLPKRLSVIELMATPWGKLWCDNYEPTPSPPGQHGCCSSICPARWRLGPGR
jgi:DNA-binding LacI/PurR family transcriptional regulator